LPLTALTVSCTLAFWACQPESLVPGPGSLLDPAEPADGGDDLGGAMDTAIGVADAPDGLADTVAPPLDAAIDGAQTDTEPAGDAPGDSGQAGPDGAVDGVADSALDGSIDSGVDGEHLDATDEDGGVIVDGGGPVDVPVDVAADAGPCEVAGAESCNGLDDDCDGQVDEGSCDDGNVCTVDACQGGACGHAWADGDCDDGQACTWGESCAKGICQLAPALVDTLAGSSAGWADGTGSKARFSFPTGLARSADGAAWVADSGNHRIRRVTVSGLVSTMAGDGVAGEMDGPAAKARFSSPAAVASSGTNLLIADTGNHRLRMLTAKGMVSTLAGGKAGFGDGLGPAASFSSPSGVDIGPGGIAFVADRDNHRIRRVMPDGTVTTLAGSKPGFADGPGAAAAFNKPVAIASDGDGALYVSDQGNRRIRRIRLSGLVTTVAGSGQAGFGDGAAAKAQFVLPAGLAMDAAGRLLIVDRGSHRLRRLSVDGQVSTIAGSGVPGFIDGAAAAASFLSPADVVARPTGEVLVIDRSNHRLRRLRDNSAGCAISGLCWQATMPNPAAPCAACLPASSSNSWSLFAPGTVCIDGDPCTLQDACSGGKCAGAASACDDGNPCTKDACLLPTGACSYLPIGGCGGLCQSDADCQGVNACAKPGANCVSGTCVDTGPIHVTTLAGSVTGSQDGPAATALLHDPAGLDYAPDGDLIFVDRGGHRIRQLAGNGVVSTLAGSGVAGYADGAGKAAVFNQPADVATAPAGIVWIADAGNHRIRLLTATGLVSTVAGSSEGFADGAAAVARFSGPRGIARSAGGARYVADTENHRIRRLEPDGSVVTLAGSVAGHVNGPGHVARFSRPWALAVDSAGNLLVADRDNHRIRRVTPQGQVSDLIGIGKQGSLDGPAALAMLDAPTSVAVDALGRIYLAGADHRIRRLAPQGALIPWAGAGSVGHVDGAAALAAFHAPGGLAVSVQGAVAVADSGNHRLRRIVDGNGACQIGAACWASGMFSASAPCLVCAGGKTWKPAFEGSPCDDGKPCTGHGGCKAGICGPAPAKNCDDGDACTKDICDAASGACQNKPTPGCNGWCASEAHCQDANPCVLGESCVNNKCDKGDPLQVDTPAGGPKGWQDGAAATARFSGPGGLAFDGQGELWIADVGNHVIRHINHKGVVSTPAGTGKVGYIDGAGPSAAFNQPADVAPIPGGKLLVADAFNHRIRQLGPTSVVSTLAGGPVGYADGTGAVARFNRPRGLAATPAGVAYVADTLNHRIRKLWPDGKVSTLAGSSAGHANGVGAAARFDRPVDVALDRWGNLVVADRDNHRLRRITPGGVVSDLAGGAQGYVDGPAAKARLHLPGAVAVDDNGRIYVADTYNNRIRALSTGGVVSTFAGSGVPDWLDGAGPKARFQLPAGLALSANGWLWAADTANHRLRRVADTAGACWIGGACLAPGLPKGPATCAYCGPASALSWSTSLNGTACGDGGLCQLPGSCLAGTCKPGKAKTCDDKDACTKDSCDASSGACVFAPIVGCAGKCLTHNDCDDGNPCTVGHACTAGVCNGPADARVSTLAGASSGFADGIGGAAKFNGPAGIAADGQGVWFIADRNNHRIRRVLPTGQVSTLGGTGQPGMTDGAALQATFFQPSDVALDGDGALWIADAGNHAIRRLTADGKVSLVAGSGVAGSKDGVGGLASFHGPVGLATGVTGVLWVADRDNHRIRKVTAKGQVTLFAGGLPGFIDGPLAQARFSKPEALAIGPDGRIWVADTGNHRLRRIEAAGVVVSVAGLGVAGGLDGPTNKALLAEPAGLAIDSGGTVWIADRLTHRLRRLAVGKLVTVAGWASGFADGDDTAARFHKPAGLALDRYGRLAIADTGNHRLRLLAPSAGSCFIEGTCRAPGLLAPGKPCLRCTAATSTKTWSAQSVSSTCADGDACTAGDACGKATCLAGKTTAGCVY